jgi:hypothetical protein
MNDDRIGDGSALQVLLVEDSPGDVRLTIETFRGLSSHTTFTSPSTGPTP